MISNIQKLAEDTILVAFNSGDIDIYQHMIGNDINSNSFTHVKRFNGIQGKRINVSVTVKDQYLVLATECGNIFLISTKTNDTIDHIDKIQKITAMC